MDLFNALQREASKTAVSIDSEETKRGLAWGRDAQTTDKSMKPQDTKDLGEKGDIKINPGHQSYDKGAPSQPSEDGAKGHKDEGADGGLKKYDKPNTSAPLVTKMARELNRLAAEEYTDEDAAKEAATKLNSATGDNYSVEAEAGIYKVKKTSAFGEGGVAEMDAAEMGMADTALEEAAVTDLAGTDLSFEEAGATETPFSDPTATDPTQDLSEDITSEAPTEFADLSNLAWDSQAQQFVSGNYADGTEASPTDLLAATVQWAQQSGAADAATELEELGDLEAPAELVETVDTGEKQVFWYKQPNPDALATQSSTPNKQGDVPAGGKEDASKGYKDPGQNGGIKSYPSVNTSAPLAGTKNTGQTTDSKGAQKHMDQGAKGDLKFNPGSKWMGGDDKQARDTEDGAKGHKDSGDKGDNKESPKAGSFDPESGAQQATANGLGEKFKWKGDSTQKMHKQFNATAKGIHKHSAEAILTRKEALECVAYDLAVIAEQNQKNSEVLTLVGKTLGLVDTIGLVLDAETVDSPNEE